MSNTLKGVYNPESISGMRASARYLPAARNKVFFFIIKVYMFQPDLSVLVLGGELFGMQFSRECATFLIGMSAFTEETSEGFLTYSVM